jgi:hypothetical protein
MSQIFETSFFAKFKEAFVLNIPEKLVNLESYM